MRSTMPISNNFNLPRSRSQAIFATRRPWPELLSHPSFYSLPRSFTEFRARIRRNLKYFRVNYAYIVLCILFVSLLWHPISLIVYLILWVAWWFLYLSREDHLVVLNRLVDDRLVMVVLGILTVVALVFTGVWLNVLVSVLIGLGIVVLHAAFRVSEDLFLDEDEAAEGGLVSVVDNNHGPWPDIPTRY